MKRRLLLSSLLILILLGGFLYYATRQELSLFALDAPTGRVAWRVGLPPTDGYTSVPQVAQNAVLLWTLVGPRGDQLRLSAFSVKRGKELWSRDAEGDVNTRVYFAKPVLAFYKDRVILQTGTDYSVLYAYDLATGDVLWKTDLGGTLFGLVAGDAPLALVAQIDPDWLVNPTKFDFLKLDLSTGQVTGRFPLPSLTDTPDRSYEPVILGNASYLYYSGDAGIYQLDRQTGEYLKTLPNLSGHLALDDAQLYLVTSNKVRAFDPETLKLRWLFDYAQTYSQDASQGDFGLPLLTSHGLYLQYTTVLQDTQAHLLALSPSGEAQWRVSAETSNRFGTSWTSVVGNDQGLFLEGRDALVAFSIEGEVRWQFPMTKQSFSFGSSEQLVFATDLSPRYRNWLAYLRPSWH